MGSMTRGSALVTAASLTVGLVTGCSGGSAPASAPTVTVTATSETSSPTATKKAAPATRSSPTSTATATGDGLPTDVGAYADKFVQAWGVGDRQEAARYAMPDALTSLFGEDARGGSTWRRGGQQVQGPATQVAYTDGTGQTLYVIVNRATAQSGSVGAVTGASIEWEGQTVPEADEPPPVVDDSSVTGLPTTVGDYADAYIRAWGVGDPVGGQYAHQWVYDTMYGGGAGGSRWSRTSSTATTVSYVNKADGSRITLTLDATRVAGGRGDAITSVSYR